MPPAGFVLVGGFVAFLVTLCYVLAYNIVYSSVIIQIYKGGNIMYEVQLGTIIESGDICPTDGIWTVIDDSGNCSSDIIIWKDSIALPGSNKKKKLKLKKHLDHDMWFSEKEQRQRGFR